MKWNKPVVSVHSYNVKQTTGLPLCEGTAELIQRWRPSVTASASIGLASILSDCCYKSACTSSSRWYLITSYCTVFTFRNTNNSSESLFKRSHAFHQKIYIIIIITTPLYTKRRLGSRRGIAPLFLNLSMNTPAACYPQERNPGTHYTGVGWAPEPAGHRGWMKKLLLGNETQLLRPQPSPYTDWATWPIYIIIL
jgi:hypothetical protein